MPHERERHERQIGKDVFVALAAIAWADGKLDPDEADAIVRAASTRGSCSRRSRRSRRRPSSRSTSASSTAAAMSKEDRLFVYAVACWIARLDGKVTADESDALAKLGERLGVPERPRAHAEAIAREVAEMPEGDRPARYDLAARSGASSASGSGGARCRGKHAC